MKRWALFLAMLVSVPFVLPTINVHFCGERPFPDFGNWSRKVIGDMIRRFGIALIVFGIFSIMAAGSARAWPRVGKVGHFSHGPVLNRGPVGFPEHYRRKPVEECNLPEGAQSRSYGDKKMEDGKKFDWQYIDVVP